MYRYGAPGRGRYREHWQLSVEAIGTDDPAIDAEIIQLYDTLLRRLGIRNYRLELNSIGCRECRPAYVEKLTAWLDEHEDELGEEAGRSSRRARCASSTSRTSGRELLEGAPKIGDSLRDACQAHFAAAPTSTRPASSMSSCHARARPRLLLAHDLGVHRPDGQRELDHLRRRPLRLPRRGDRRAADAGVGFGAGIERLLIAMEDEASPTPRRPRPTCSSPVEPDAPRELVPPLLKGLRDAGVAADTDYAGGRSRASSRRRGARAPTTVILRPDDALIRRQGRAGRTGRPRGRSRQTVAMRPWRTHMAGEPTKELVGENSTSRAGRAAPRPRRPDLRRPPRPQRDHAARDQPELAAEAAELAHQIRNEFVLRAEARSSRAAPRPSTRT